MKESDPQDYKGRKEPCVFGVRVANSVRGTIHFIAYTPRAASYHASAMGFNVISTSEVPFEEAPKTYRLEIARRLFASADPLKKSLAFYLG